ncbi:MAG TPA: PilZ domain-containing protein, partial [Clostridia bacterium]
VVEILAPFYEGNIYPVHQYMVMDVIFSKENDTYMFKGEAVQRFNQDNIAMLKVKPITPIRKIQRRAFFRMDCTLNVRYRTLDNIIISDDDIKGDGEFSEAKTKDISGGGICMLTDVRLDKSSYIEAFIELDNEIRFVGEIVRSNVIKKRGKLMYETGVEFKKIENRDREKIIGYIHEIQRERLKKGWLRA